ncbi:DNA repair protein RecN [Halpernia frigidisoli]|uniref:DNA repair protein RecN n=1 Tax=Halpernia frigidisoli TaxID=1125876 RepID=A0A1I3HU15_9FLAO|nr:AAA family ATPase [Halpernia frigidisoli]SFI39152.1 DNA repair protein RecN (Recombination protein N) [Halpernia frigidisoli]
MLTRIFIKNFALIDHLEINLHEGLQVITGETGAGKSIILGALRLILGERADVKSISNSDSKSIVEAEFKLNDNFKNYFDSQDLDYDSHTIIRREILPTGKSRAFINDVPVTLEVLKNLSQRLIDIHSQFETSNIFNEDYQFKIIDGLSENKNLLPNYQREFSEYLKLKNHLEKLKTQLSEGNKEADYKDFLLNELLDSDLDTLDFDELQNQLSTQENAEQISENLAQIIQNFGEENLGIFSQLNDARIKLNKIAQLSNHFENPQQRLEEVWLELKDLLLELENEAENIDINGELLQELNLKTNKINSLFLKHNVNSVVELINIRNEISENQSQFLDLENEIDKTEKSLESSRKNLEKSVKILSENRRKIIPVFTKKIEAIIKQLGLEKAKIEVDLKESGKLSTFGKENIQILFQANSGFPLKPIQDAISGGERSRVMLSIKKIMAENSELPSLILDEIDTGVSGKIAEEMGNVMQEMAKDLQLIVITHLAQVAAKGNNNYKVVKQDISGKTQSNIIPLNEAEKLQEIAQLLSGSKITEAAVLQAKELIG